MVLSGHSSSKTTWVHLVRAYSNRADLLERLTEVVQAVEERRPRSKKQHRA